MPEYCKFCKEMVACCQAHECAEKAEVRLEKELAEKDAKIAALEAEVARLKAIVDAARVVSSQRNGPYLMTDADATMKAESELKHALAALVGSL